MLKNTALLLLFLFVSCATTSTSLSVKMVSPPSDTNTFENDHIKIIYSFTPSARIPGGNIFMGDEVTGVGIELTNKASEPIKIVWDDISLIIDGQAHRVIHAGVRLVEKETPQATTIVPPGASITDVITPFDNIHLLTDTWAYDALIERSSTGKHTIRVYFVYILNDEPLHIDTQFEVSVIRQPTTSYYQ